MSYKQPRRDRADEYLPEQIELLGKLFPGVEIKPTTPEDDMARNTDVYLGDRRVMLRMDYTQWTDGVIFRYTATANEWKKVCAGYGDWMLFCWSQSDRIGHWALINLRLLVNNRQHIRGGMHYWTEGRDHGRCKLHWDKIDKVGCRLWLGGIPLGVVSPSLRDAE